MRITQWGEYAVHFAVYFAERQLHGEPLVTAQQIASSQNIDLDYTQQILQRLRKGGIIESIRGPQGGYRLTRLANSITLLDILIAAEGDTFEIICESKPLSPERCGSTSGCEIRHLWQDLRTHVNAFLIKYNLEELAKKNQPVETLVQIRGPQ